MIKVVTTLRKKIGMSTEDFRGYYESHHRLIGEKYLDEFALRYMRRYLDPLPDANGQLAEPEFDVLLEIWFADMDVFQACGARLSEPEVAEEIARDEEQLFDRNQKRSYLVEECESKMAKQL